MRGWSRDQWRGTGPGGAPRREFVPGRVVAVMRKRAVIEVRADGRRRLWELGQADVDFARLIPDMRRWYAPGDRVCGATVTDPAGRGRYTLLAGRSNPWPALIARFPPGATVTGPVVGVCHGIGAFVEVAAGINGRVPFAEARWAGLTTGVWVQVSVVSADPVLRRIGLRLHRVLGSRSPAHPSPGVPR
jgi:small subunit ribosomal protein S1